jgi:hypothetical protein
MTMRADRFAIAGRSSRKNPLAPAILGDNTVDNR